jgi:hypothetical protein
MTAPGQFLLAIDTRASLPLPPGLGGIAGPVECALTGPRRAYRAGDAEAGSETTHPVPSRTGTGTSAAADCSSDLVVPPVGIEPTTHSPRGAASIELERVHERRSCLRTFGLGPALRSGGRRGTYSAFRDRHCGRPLLPSRKTDRPRSPTPSPGRHHQLRRWKQQVFAQVRAPVEAVVVKARQTLHAHGAATEGCWFETRTGSQPVSSCSYEKSTV